MDRVSHVPGAEPKPPTRTVADTAAEDACLQSLRRERQRLAGMLRTIDAAIAAYEPPATAATSLLIQRRAIAAPFIPPQPQSAPPEDTRLFTPARNEVIRRRYPQGDSEEDIKAELLTLPGRKDIPKGRIAIHASGMGLHRPRRHGQPEAVPAVPQPQPRPSASDPVVPQAAPGHRVAAPTPAQRVTRASAMAAVSKAIDARASAPPAVAGERILADFDQVANWAGQRGVQFESWDHLQAVNARAERIGHPGFMRKWGRR